MKKKEESSGVECICCHRIKWWYEVGDIVPQFTELPESEVEHIKHELCRDIVCGELCYCDENDNTFYGWWEIER